MLEQQRKRLDIIDNELVRLFEERMEIVGEIAEIKRNENLPITNAAREREVIARLTQDKQDEIAGFIKILFTTLFDLSRARQASVIRAESSVAARITGALEGTPKLFPKSAVVACQGVEGANSTAACEKLFTRPSITYFSSFEGVFAAVDKNLCQYGILPIENSLQGSVTEVYDLMEKYNFSIVRSTRLKINHMLLAKPGVALGDIKRIYSHEQALGQCGAFLKTLNAEIIPCENTAVAAKLVSEGEDNSAAAISSIQCAELYNLTILGKDIQDNSNNYTRFICISKNLEIYPGARKLSLMMTLPHRPGSLYGLMAKFAALGLNLTKLESRALSDRDFEFLFYFDLDVSVYDEALLNLFSQLEEGQEKFMLLGCYAEL